MLGGLFDHVRLSGDNTGGGGVGQGHKRVMQEGRRRGGRRGGVGIPLLGRRDAKRGLTKGTGVMEGSRRVEEEFRMVREGLRWGSRVAMARGMGCSGGEG